MEKLEIIFNKQLELMEKYHPIEQANGLLHTTMIPVNLDDRFGQAQLKDLAWRFTEELGEAMDEFLEDKMALLREELSDCLHFLAEFTILSGMTAGDLGKLEIMMEGAKPAPSLSGLELMSLTVMSLSKTCHYLKNRPWKQSHTPTNTGAFYYQLYVTWIRFLSLCLWAGYDAELLVRMYLSKHQVNQERQQSGY